MYTQFKENSNNYQIRTLPSPNRKTSKNQNADFNDNRNLIAQQQTIQAMVTSNKFGNVIQCAGNSVCFTRFRHAVSATLGAAVWGAISAVTTACFETGNSSKAMLTMAWQGALSNTLGAIGGIFIGFIINKLLECLGNYCCSENEESDSSSSSENYNIDNQIYIL